MKEIWYTVFDKLGAILFTSYSCSTSDDYITRQKQEDCNITANANDWQWNNNTA